MLLDATESTVVRARGAALPREHRWYFAMIGPPRSMARRVAKVAILSAALGGLAAATLAAVAVDRALTEQADVRLRGATDTLAGELDEDGKRFSASEIRRTLDDENEEIVTSGIRLAVYAGDRFVSGDHAVPRPPDGLCDTRGRLPDRVHACARPYHQLTLIASQPSDEMRLLGLYALSCVIAIVLGAVVGGVSSTALTRWAVKPLEEVTGALERLKPDTAEPDLGPASPSDDVESIRRALLDLLARVSDLIGQARRFAGDAAHELRTPLATLRAELELLGEGTEGPTREALARATSRADKLSGLVDRLLVLALPAQNLAQGFENVALSDVVTDAIAHLPAEARARVRPELDVEGLVRGDERLLSSLVTNALENALKFSNGSIGVRLTETATSELALEVTDGGPGVPEGLRNRVFEPFFRAAPAAKAGYGLGLALIGHIARVHGGVATFADTSAGARLVVTLPAWESAGV
jgi:two-component system, OmpR family, sensor kinase